MNNNMFFVCYKSTNDEKVDKNNEYYFIYELENDTNKYIFFYKEIVKYILKKKCNNKNLIENNICYYKNNNLTIQINSKFYINLELCIELFNFIDFDIKINKKNNIILFKSELLQISFDILINYLLDCEKEVDKERYKNLLFLLLNINIKLNTNFKDYIKIKEKKLKKYKNKIENIDNLFNKKIDNLINVLYNEK